MKRRWWLMLSDGRVRPQVGEYWPDACPTCKRDGRGEQFHKVETRVFPKWDDEGDYETNIVECVESDQVFHLMYAVTPLVPLDKAESA